jgi:hypothetical protein
LKKVGRLLQDTVRTAESGGKFLAMEWDKCYDLVEYIVSYYSNKNHNDKLVKWVNKILREESCGYRIIDQKIAPITSNEEIVEIEKSKTHFIRVITIGKFIYLE